MSHFIYKAKKPSGEIYNAERDAADRYELYKAIRDNGDEIVEFRERGPAKGLKMEISFKGLGSLGSHVKTIDKINFARNLSAMLEAGLALSRALSVLERQTASKPLKKVIGELLAEINKGSSFADALSQHKKVFSELFISMVHAGEQSGMLSESLKVTATQMDSAYNLERRIRGALIYPVVVFTAMVVIGILMFIFVIPVLLKTFTDLGVQLPLSTRVILAMSGIVQHQGILLLIILAIIGGLVWWWIKKPSGKSFMDALILKIPIIGLLAQETNAARAARTLASLLGSGVDVVESLIITANVVQNVHYREVLQRAAETVKKGEVMSKIFSEETKLYPVFFSEMVSVGEETGKTGEMLLGVAHYYEDEVEQKTKDMSTIVEPILIVLIGGAVGFFAVSMIQPIYSLVNAIH